MLADPLAPLAERAQVVTQLRDRGDRAVLAGLISAQERLEHTVARLTTLGPAATLARGYAVVQRIDGARPGPVLRTVADAPDGAQLRIRLSDGPVTARVGPARKRR